MTCSEMPTATTTAALTNRAQTIGSLTCARLEDLAIEMLG